MKHLLSSLWEFVKDIFNNEETIEYHDYMQRNTRYNMYELPLYYEEKKPFYYEEKRVIRHRNIND